MCTRRLATLVLLAGCAEGTLGAPMGAGTDEPEPWVVEESEPNDVSHKGLGGIESWDDAQALPDATGDGQTDTVTGTLVFETDDPKYTSDNDGFLIVPPFDLAVTATVSWNGTVHNLDMIIYAVDGSVVGTGFDEGDTQPEVYDGVAAEQTLAAGETYILTLMGWEGPAADVDYTLELLWTAEPG